MEGMYQCGKSDLPDDERRRLRQQHDEVTEVAFHRLIKMFGPPPWPDPEPETIERFKARVREVFGETQEGQGGRSLSKGGKP